MRARLQEARARLAHSGNKGASVEAAFRKPVSYTHLTLPTIYSV